MQQTEYILQNIEKESEMRSYWCDGFVIHCVKDVSYLVMTHNTIVNITIFDSI